jgi:hypothetical protein
MPIPSPRTEKTSKKINKNNKNFKFQNPHATNFYGKFENLKIDIFYKKVCSKLKWL